MFIRGLTRNLETENTPIWVLSNIWRLGQVRATKFGMIVPNQFFFNADDKIAAFTISELLTENQQTGVKIPHITPRLGLNEHTKLEKPI